MVRRGGQTADELAELGAEIVPADLTDRKSLAEALDGITGVIHIAAVFRQAGYPDSHYYEVNAIGTQNLFEVAIEKGVKRIIHCSTTGVVSHVPNPPADESAPYKPADVYQASKAQAEKIALEFYRSGKIGGVVIRPTMIYGPGDTRTLKLFKLIARKRFFYVGRGEAFVHWVDVRDLAKAFVLALDRKELNGEIYTVGGQQWMHLKDCVRVIAGALGVPTPWLHLPVVPMQLLGTACEKVCRPLGIEPPIFRRRVDFFVKNRAFNISKAERELGYKPAKSFDQEISEIVDSYRGLGWL